MQIKLNTFIFTTVNTGQKHIIIIMTLNMYTFTEYKYAYCCTPIIINVENSRTHPGIISH